MEYDVSELKDLTILSVNDVAKYLGIGVSYAYRIIKTNNFPIWKVGRKIIIYKEFFFYWLRNYYRPITEKKADEDYGVQKTLS